jgi:hypothetical protein
VYILDLILEGYAPEGYAPEEYALEDRLGDSLYDCIPADKNPLSLLTVNGDESSPILTTSPSTSSDCCESYAGLLFCGGWNCMVWSLRRI